MAPERDQSTGSVAKEFGEAEGQFDALAAVQPGIAHCLVAVSEVTRVEFTTTTQAFRDIIPGEFEMNAPRMTPYPMMGCEKPSDFRQDVIEVPCLVTLVSTKRVAVHWVAHPNNGVSGDLNRFQEWR